MEEASAPSLRKLLFELLQGDAGERASQIEKQAKTYLIHGHTRSGRSAVSGAEPRDDRVWVWAFLMHDRDQPGHADDQLSP